MYHKQHDEFIEAIHSKNKIKLTFFSKEDQSEIVRVCAPMDFGPFRKAKLPIDRYHLWDYESDKTVHNLALIPENIRSMDILPHKFDPVEFVSWTCNWFIVRDWGQYS